MKNNLNLFKETFKFASELTPNQMEKLKHASRIIKIDEGTNIVENNQECPGLALILSGTIKISRLSEDGREVTLYRIGRGETCVLSAICILGAGFDNYSITATAEQDSLLMLIQPGFVRSSGVECEPLWKFIFTSMADSLLRTAEIVEKVAFMPLSKRIARALMEFSREGRHPVYTTHDSIAKELGTAREVVSRQLKALERKGIISMSRGKIDILLPDELSKII